MTLALTFVSFDAAARDEAATRLEQAVAAQGASVKARNALGPGARDWLIENGDLSGLRGVAATALHGLPVDMCIQPTDGRRKRLLIADMDSTIIGCECLDELASYAGVKAEVSAITERAMRGELDFAGALRERVAMLEGLPLEALGRCYAERVRLNPGARTLAASMAANRARCLLVSGGFKSFTSRVARAAGFHADFANVLLSQDGRLTGRVTEPILGREAKLVTLLSETERLGLTPADAIAVGDGANDLDMIRASGLGVAYRAKPVVAVEADARVDHFDLTALLYFQGYTEAEFVRDDRENPA